MSAAEFRELIEQLSSDPAVAGISIKGSYESLTGHTVTPPAGTMRQDGQDVGIYSSADGEEMATLDTWGSVASRCETLLAGPYGDLALADVLGFPLITFVDEEGTVLTTSVELSHRQADATWRLCRDELREAGVPFDDIQQATRTNPDALLAGFPTAIPFGWWHSHTKRSQAAIDKTPKDKAGAKASADTDLARTKNEYLGYYVMNPADSRSARLFTAEFTAVGVNRRPRMAAKVDALFAAVSDEQTVAGQKLSTLGLGSIPPTRISSHADPKRPGPTDLTYRVIESRAFLSFTGLRAFRFSEPTAARTLVTALTFLLYSLLHQNLSFRAGTELRLLEPGLEVRVERHGETPEPLTLPPAADLIELVRELGAEVGWGGPRVVTIPAGSPLGKVIGIIDGKAKLEHEDES